MVKVLVVGGMVKVIGMWYMSLFFFKARLSQMQLYQDNTLDHHQCSLLGAMILPTHFGIPCHLQNQEMTKSVKVIPLEFVLQRQMLSVRDSELTMERPLESVTRVTS